MGEAGRDDWSDLFKDKYAKVDATMIDGLRAMYEGGQLE